ncbi:MAG TPA: LytTR family transcriptional regulator DNA-binding domain-containing protein [Pyrinomonadaceae bacterium]|nr:LytTR family transcriptional regulator DNA-binding domain-containing protein [Pyrinomonadaceae bacterium]
MIESDPGRKKIRTVIVDDEPLARRNIRILLRDEPTFEIVGEAANGREAIALISHSSPDLVFLDIQMPEIDGFGVLENIEAERLPVIVFVTAFDQYALKAFEFHALDYLLKPFDDARFEKALRQAKRQIEQREVQDLSKRLVALLEGRDNQSIQKPEKQSHVSRLLIKSSGRVSFLKTDEIDYIQAEDYYVKVQVGRKGHLLRETMNEMEVKLDPAKFLRIHRSTIVNIERIRELQQHFNGDYIVVLHDGSELKLSRSRREQLQKLLKSGRL